MKKLKNKVMAQNMMPVAGKFWNGNSKRIRGRGGLKTGASGGRGVRKFLGSSRCFKHITDLESFSSIRLHGMFFEMGGLHELEISKVRN